MTIAKIRLTLCVALVASLARIASTAADTIALQDATILIIRHAEKPAEGRELAPEGFQRADAYVKYFEDFKLDGQAAKWDHIYATADSKGSERPRLTVTPLAKDLKLALDTRFKDKSYQELASDIQSTPHGKHILVCWHHGNIPKLVQALGAEPEKLLPNGKWPDDVFNWVIELHYDHDGHLIPAETKRFNEHLMPRDAQAAE